jgi:hypothetical protein
LKFDCDQGDDVGDDQNAARARIFEQIETFGETERQNEQNCADTGSEHRMQVPSQSKVRPEVRGERCFASSSRAKFSFKRSKRMWSRQITCLKLILNEQQKGQTTTVRVHDQGDGASVGPTTSECLVNQTVIRRGGKLVGAVAKQQQRSNDEEQYHLCVDWIRERERERSRGVNQKGHICIETIAYELNGGCQRESARSIEDVRQVEQSSTESGVDGQEDGGKGGQRSSITFGFGRST